MSDGTDTVQKYEIPLFSHLKPLENGISAKSKYKKPVALSANSVMVNMAMKDNDRRRIQITSRYKHIWNLNKWLFMAALEEMFVPQISYMAKEKGYILCTFRINMLETVCVFQRREKKESCIVSQFECFTFQSFCETNHRWRKQFETDLYCYTWDKLSQLPLPSINQR